MGCCCSSRSWEVTWVTPEPRDWEPAGSELLPVWTWLGGSAVCGSLGEAASSSQRVCPRANAFIFTVPRGKATRGGHEKQEDFTKMIRCCFQMWFSAGDANQ